jgi:sigma-B regulation protein RsbU (phosphoserine phosphatase)
MKLFSRWIYLWTRHRKLLTKLREARQEVETLFRFETLVHDITTRFINLASEKYDEVINTLLRDIGEFIGIDRAYLFVITADRKAFNNTHEWEAKGIGQVDISLKYFLVNTFTWWRRSLFEKDYVYFSSIADLPDDAEAERRFMSLGRIHSMLLVPLLHKGSLDGFIGFDTVRGRKIWNRKEIYLLKSVAQDIVNLRLRWEAERELQTTEMQLAKLREEDLETSARIQRTILTAEPKIDNPAVDIAALTIPSQEVDGDFYNAMNISGDTFDILSGDVMGKSLPGAFIAAAVRNRFLQVKLDMAMLHPKGQLPGPAQIVAAVALRTTPEIIKLESFVSLTYSRFNLSSHRLNFVDCGHTPIIHFHRDTERCWLLKGRNSPLGFLANETYSEHSVFFSEGDILFFYSDGISEARNQNGDMFGEQRLVSVIEQNYEKPTRSIITAVKDAVIGFCEGNPLADDFTCLTVKLVDVPGSASALREKIFPGDMTSLPGLRSFIEECLEEKTGIPFEKKAQIIFAGNEAASNIIQYGVSRDDGKEPAGFCLKVEMHPDWVCLCFLYGGKPFDLPQPKMPQIENMEERGYGIFIIEEFMDSIIYSGDIRGGRMISLAKRFDV